MLISQNISNNTSLQLTIIEDQTIQHTCLHDIVKTERDDI